jgi:mannose-6-phosphate isomerase-like protein (cupin superfamily)
MAMSGETDHQVDSATKSDHVTVLQVRPGQHMRFRHVTDGRDEYWVYQPEELFASMALYRARV